MLKYWLIVFIIIKADCVIDRFPRLTKCINREHPNKEEIDSFKRKEIPKTEAGKCLLACYLESRGLLTSSGRFSPQGASRLAANVYPGNIVKTGHARHILSHCGAVVKSENNSCELATKLAHCTTTLSEQFKL
ncbi:uncharacterized protein LOC106662719 [Cimex lectularius]|uniref:Odorant binding protein n=1 Tax=Cimex lectularius TaxID=79782 RepID=A0A8I6RD30_CIMLE|nr:uncharacterized protein LOC106662719 [Cimex lectularius]